MMKTLTGLLGRYEELVIQRKSDQDILRKRDDELDELRALVSLVEGKLGMSARDFLKLDEPHADTKEAPAMAGTVSRAAWDARQADVETLETGYEKMREERDEGRTEIERLTTIIRSVHAGLQVPWGTNLEEAAEKARTQRDEAQAELGRERKAHDETAKVHGALRRERDEALERHKQAHSLRSRMDEAAKLIGSAPVLTQRERQALAILARGEDDDITPAERWEKAARTLDDRINQAVHELREAGERMDIGPIEDVIAKAISLLTSDEAAGPALEKGGLIETDRDLAVAQAAALPGCTPGRRHR